ncbi:urease accessory protein [Sphingobium indicum]|uniref:Urease accessory protein UreD n=2 Tax=Sphingobium indicum TaxID=332055 RepID=A0A1L5BPA4_SPHIB|nr:urease accessory protein UreD [Sphingobium indicum]APL94693.1 urease accessory protein [Sphingobium indicum B90A]NYI23164.1 urease accessory protein [Sphingobium indicum]RYM04438.1 urease accessory protein [Sphingobium indicum]
MFGPTFDPDIGRQAARIASGPCAVPNSLRSHGELRLAFGQRNGRTVMKDSYQAGCLRARMPRRDEGGRPCAVLINTAGGLAEGDSVRQSVRWAAETSATVTGQAAEKVYRALSHGCRIYTQLRVEQGADAEWLPQETILFDRARLARETRILLDADVTFLGLEAVVLGRAAMGERMAHGALGDRMRIYRNGRLIYADALALEGDVDAMMRRSAIGGGAGAMAVIVHASARAAALLEPVRQALAEPAGRAAASAWNGLLAIRLLAPDGAALRADIMAALMALREGRPLPRVWRC